MNTNVHDEISQPAKMPVLFIGHGDPRLVLGENRFFDTWGRIGSRLPRPKAVLCISAHWETDGVQVTAMEKPRTIHDFYGFSDEMYAQDYPSPGAPALARELAASTQAFKPELDFDWGLDHGTWCILKPMFPLADIPVFQLSLDRNAAPRRHYELGLELKRLRKEGVLIVGSGNIVHNLRHAFSPERQSGDMQNTDWALEFDATVRDLVLDRNHAPLWDYHSLGPAAQMAVPTPEHYLPLLYALAASDSSDDVSFACEDMEYGAISMRTILFGA